MKQERPHRQVISLNAYRADRTYRRLLDELIAYCEEHLHEEPWAQDQFYGEPPSETESATLHEAFLEWMAFDYRDWDGRTMLERFVAQAELHGDAEPDLLRSWEGSRFGLYRVLSFDAGSVQLRDCFTDHDYTVQIETDMEPFSAKDLVICRILPVGEGFRFGCDVRTGPIESEPLVRQALERQLTIMQRQQPEATWHDLFATRWPLLHDAMTGAIVAGRVPPAPSGPHSPPSLGLTQPPPWATPFQRQVADRLDAYLVEEDLSWGDRRRAQQLWWDTAARLRPAAGKAAGWAAGVAYALLRFMIDDEITQQEVAEAFMLSVSTVGARFREIADALELVDLDDRYTDPLDPRVRLLLQHGALDFRTLLSLRDTAAGREAPDPFATFFLDYPEQFEELRRLDMEGYALLRDHEWHAARDRFTEALRLCPEAPPPRNHMALSYLLEGRPADAIETVLSVLEHYPDLIYTLALLAICHAEKGEMDAAGEFCQRAHDVYVHTRATDPYYPAPERQSDLAMVTEALAALEQNGPIVELVRGEELEHTLPSTLHRAARSALQQGLTDEARRWNDLAAGRRNS